MLDKKDRWSALSMSERADLIKLYVSNGITSINDIKKDYNSFDDGGKKSKIITTEMTPSQAIKYNESADNAAFMIPYGGTPDNPEFLYPEELEAAVTLASAKEAEQKALEKEVAKLNSSDAWKYIGLRQGENIEANKHAREYVEPLVNTAIGGIGGTLLATNPFTTELAIDALHGAGHATHVMLDPLAANTMFGAFLGTASQAAGITAGIYNASNTIDKWRSGNFNWYDIPYFALDATSAVPVINTMFGLADDAVQMVNNTYKTQRAARNATKPMTNGDPGLAQDYINAAGNAVEPVQVDPRVAKIYNQQITGKLSSKHPSKLTPDESSGTPKEIRNRKNKVPDEIFGFSTKQRKLEDIGNINKREILDKIKEGYYVSPYKLEEYMIDNILGRDVIKVYDLHNDFGTNFAPQTIKSADNILKFASSLDDIPMSDRIAGLQIDDSGITPSLINLYRRYLNKLGYNNSTITDEQLSRLLQHNYNQMVSTQRGVGKGTILFHGEGKIQPSETFDLFTDIGKNLDNLGRSGPGMYFSTQPGYSSHNNGYNIQPYLINNIDDIVTATSLGYSGSLPTSGKGNVRDYLTYYQKIAKDLGVSPEEFKKGIINATTGERNILVADFFENNASGAIYGYPLHGLDFRYRGPSQNIKSLFPHPDRFVTNPDGTVSFTPVNWNDPRFNFKNGGKLLTKRK